MQKGKHCTFKSDAKDGKTPDHFPKRQTNQAEIQGENKREGHDKLGTKGSQSRGQAWVNTHSTYC